MVTLGRGWEDEGRAKNFGFSGLGVLTESSKRRSRVASICIAETGWKKQYPSWEYMLRPVPQWKINVFTFWIKSDLLQENLMKKICTYKMRILTGHSLSIHAHTLYHARTISVGPFWVHQRWPKPFIFVETFFLGVL